LGEYDVFERYEQAFFRSLEDIEILSIKEKQSQAMIALKVKQEQILKDLKQRKSNKKFQREQQRQLKSLYLQTQFRAALFSENEIVKESLKVHREKSAKIVIQIEERHLKQIKQFNAAEERDIQDQTFLINLQCKTLAPEQMSETMKKFQAKINHQKVINKKKLDNIREQQRLELLQFKERIDLETV
jgi:hypothetical protein